MTADELAGAVRQYMEGLGGTADVIHDRFLTLGIKGRRGDACQCPLAVAIRRAFPEVNVFAVGRYTANLYVGGVRFRVQLPEPVTVFVKRVDGGVYLDLILVEAGVTA